MYWLHFKIQVPSYGICEYIVHQNVTNIAKGAGSVYIQR